MKLFLAIISALVAGGGLVYFANRVQGDPTSFHVHHLDPIQIEEERVEGDPFSTGKGRAFVCRANATPLPKELSYIDQFFGGFSTDPPLGAVEQFFAVSDRGRVIGVLGVVTGEDVTVSIAECTFLSGHYILSDQRYFKNAKLSTWLKRL